MTVQKCFRHLIKVCYRNVFLFLVMHLYQRRHIFASVQKVISCRPIFPQFPHVRWGEHFLFGQFLKLSKLFRNFLSNERIVNYGQKLAQRKRNFCQITNLFPTWAQKFEAAEIKKGKSSQFCDLFLAGRREVGKWSVV